jgi:L-rhamnose isomerase
VELEREGNYLARLALLEELKTMPFGAVWDYHCLTSGIPAGEVWISKIINYKKEVFRRRI